MGALADSMPSPALRIQHALDELNTGNSLEFLRLQHTLRGTNPSTLTPILSGLTHFAVRLHHDAPQRPLHTLFDMALQIDLPTVASNQIALQATTIFLRNLISADVSFIQPVLQLVTRAFLLPLDAREHLMETFFQLIEFLLATHPRAAELVIATLKRNYPHPVRSVEEHVPYVRGVLAVARRCRTVTAALTNIVYERIASVETLVPQTIEDPLCNEAEKMESLLLELCNHFDEARGKSFLSVFEPAYEAYEAFVIPCEARFSPYTILYGAEIGGPSVVGEVIDRLLVRFFDTRVSGRQREKFLEHCCGLVVRAKSMDEGMLQNWVRRMAEWLNKYIDSAVRRQGDWEVDVDVHHVFYSAFLAFVTVVVRRAGNCGLDFADFRVGRIVGCGMRPLVMIDDDLSNEFMAVVGDSVVCEFDRYRPSRTKFGRPNQLRFTVRLKELELSRARKHVGEVVLWDAQLSKGVHLEVDDEVEEGVEMSG